jgi:hypothetical protein
MGMVVEKLREAKAFARSSTGMGRRRRRPE